MTPERWQQIDGLFQEALARAAPERDTFLHEACGEDEDLRAEVLSLLASHQKASQSFPSDNISTLFLDVLNEDEDGDGGATTISERVGNYKLLGEIGRGGMGVVYLAERNDAAYHKRVAIKIIKRGLDIDFILDRFRTERQILAGFDHTNIARLLDGGTTAAGLPFFVMEYIEGKPLNDYCDEKGLSVTERLVLFRQVCSAVQYAHQRLVIHRDIKPSNILVTVEEGGEGVPKLLDFGIAKLLSGETHDYETETLPLMRMITPEYASPEHLRGEPLPQRARAEGWRS
jgi:serine/threonine protein kinase